MTRCRDDRGDIVLGWLTKLVVVIGLLGLLAFDGISLGLGRLKAEDHAQSAAREAVFAYRDSKDVQRAYEASLAALEESGATLDPEAFVVHADGSVTVTVEHTMSTFVVEKVDAIAGWARSTATATARPGL
ncbi:MAG TPA: hypothetical protein VNU26_15740 [Mycobacteriales bacterium]|nr:hypothetical protein [Mycobacteriales bacterium]